MRELITQTRRLRNALDALYRPAGIDRHKFIVLESLARHDPEPRLPSQLADDAGIKRTTMTIILDQLESRSWVQRHRDPEDRRTVKIILTSEGRRVANRLRRHLRRVCLELVGDVGEADVRHANLVITGVCQRSGELRDFSAFQLNRL